MELCRAEAGGVGQWDPEAADFILRQLLFAPTTAGLAEELTPFLGRTQPVPLHRHTLDPQDDSFREPATFEPRQA